MSNTVTFFCCRLNEDIWHKEWLLLIFGHGLRRPFFQQHCYNYRRGLSCRLKANQPHEQLLKPTEELKPSRRNDQSQDYAIVDMQAMQVQVFIWFRRFNAFDEQCDIYYACLICTQLQINDSLLNTKLWFSSYFIHVQK